MSALGFLPTSANGSTISGVLYIGVTCELPNEKKIQPLNALTIAESNKKFENDATKSQALARARQRLASRLSNAPEFSLSALRLRCGLSQSKLAEKMNAKQPYIARIESGDDDVKVSTILNFAKALNVPEDEVFNALMQTRKNRIQNDSI